MDDLRFFSDVLLRNSELTLVTTSLDSSEQFQSDECNDEELHSQNL